MISLDALSTVTNERKVRLRAVLRQGQAHDFFGTATILGNQSPPLVRIVLSGQSSKDRPSARAMDPGKDFYIRLGIGTRAAIVKMHMYKVESDDKALFEPVAIEQEEQNRTFFRVQACFETKIILKDGSKNTCTYHQGEVKDISGGGLLMHTTVHYKPGTVLDLEFSLDIQGQQTVVYCTARVIRCLSVGHSGYETAVEFLDLVEEQRDAIMAYCFAQQREQLREMVQVKEV
jgi:hypothetical protein